MVLYTIWYRVGHPLWRIDQGNVLGVGAQDAINLNKAEADLWFYAIAVCKEKKILPTGIDPNA